MDGKKVLPKMGVTEQQKNEEANHQAEVKKLIEEENKKDKKFPQKEVDPNLMEEFEKQRMAFQGDFDLVDDEIKVKVKALSITDFQTLKQLSLGEMSRDEMKLYVAEG